MSKPARKIDLLRAAMAAAEWEKALSIAAKFPRLGQHEFAIRCGNEAAQRPEFQRQLGKDPQAIVNAGIAALKERYNVE